MLKSRTTERSDGSLVPVRAGGTLPTDRAEGSSVPLVSAIVTSFNVRAYVSQAIESLLAQPYPNVELIVIDDGSTDGTAEIVDRFRSEPRVRVFHQENAGSAAARNAGARVARGTFLAFLDGDDVATEQRISAGVRALGNHPDAALAYGRIDLVDEQGLLLASRSNLSRYRSGWVANELRYRNFIPFSTITVRPGAFWALGGFDETVRSSEDWEFLFRLTCRYPVIFVDRRMVLYRVRRGSKTMDIKAKEQAIRAVQQKIFPTDRDGGTGHALPRLANACRWMGLAGTLVKIGEMFRASAFFLRAVCCHPAVLFLFRSEIRDGLARVVARRRSASDSQGQVVECSRESK